MRAEGDGAAEAAGVRACVTAQTRLESGLNLAKSRLKPEW